MIRENALTISNVRFKVMPVNKKAAAEAAEAAAASALASALIKRRWAKLTPEERSAQVPRNGGRPKIYPPCLKFGKHRFSRKTGTCPCGQKTRAAERGE